ncbi:helix-turn-helix domain-containing protein [Sphingobacterium paludis]|jgi:AraC family transcriptional regulator, transcriptional activator of pobA|uniref:AraC family transcriptional regulator n=1 Tax=Sphingobacterium paludis TaxID=1476465 RepID=A0A4R7D9M8_9SPHI|nr:helix-turn-helix transcriptional regulator [Sphingobacterium paludis]TDS17467.1 AraC family transcriptional regulator [Sphingobacterium paludis]
MKTTFRLNSIAEFHAFCKLPHPEHPLISLVDYSQVSYPFDETNVKWVQNFYTIGLKRNVHGKFNYGQQEYDFNSGILSFIAPAQFLKLEIDLNKVVEPTGWLLLIHPDFLWNTALTKKIKSYDFFQYAVNEALFLSDKEEKIIVDILRNIEKEYQSNIDKFSQELIIAQLDMLLIYSERFYERQFLTRRKSNYELLARFENLLADYFDQGALLQNGMPTVTSIAEQLNISPNYLGTLLRLHTQQNTQQHIQNKLIDYAKEQLSSTNLSVSEIAYALGFEHPQSFSKLFKSKTSQTPVAFRQSFN